jgi:hypothetical protein
VRLLGEAKGTCAARQRKFGKQPPRVHHAMQNSLPASFVGGRCLRRMLRVPPGRNVISLKSAYVCGFVMRATSHSARHLARQCRHRCFCHRRRASRKGRAACVSTGRSVGARCWPRLHVRWRNPQPAVRGILKRSPFQVLHHGSETWRVHSGCTLGQIDGDAVEIFVCTHLHRPQNSRKVCYVNYLVARQVIFYRSVTKGAIFWRVTAVDHSASTYGCGVDTRTGVPTR